MVTKCFLCLKENWSTIAVVMVSQVGNNEDKASVNSMEKKRNDQRGETGISSTAVG